MYFFFDLVRLVEWIVGSFRSLVWIGSFLSGSLIDRVFRMIFLLWFCFVFYSLSLSVSLSLFLPRSDEISNIPGLDPVWIGFMVASSVCNRNRNWIPEVDSFAVDPRCWCKSFISDYTFHLQDRLFVRLNQPGSVSGWILNHGICMIRIGYFS